MSEFKEPITVAFTGASGVQYGLRLIECLINANHEVYVLISKAGHMVFAMETDLKIPASPKKSQEFLMTHFNAKPEQIKVFGQEEWTAPVASGNGGPKKMVVVPCTTGTLAGIALGTSNNLIERAADVTIKEGRKLILAVREMPLSAIHLEHMANLAKLGVVIMPPNPGFYHEPKTIEDLIDFVVARMLDHLDVEQTLLPRWGA